MKEKPQKPGRDPRGVRINNYTETTHGRYKSEPAGPDLTRVLIDTMKRDFFQTTKTAEGVEVVRHPGGRPPKYPTPESFLNVIEEYFDYIDTIYSDTGVDLIPDVEGFCSFAGISRDTLHDWQRSRGPEFSDIIIRLKNTIAGYKKQLAQKGKIPPIVFAMDMNNNHGYVQQNTVRIEAGDRLQALPAADEIKNRLPGSAGGGPEGISTSDL